MDIDESYSAYYTGPKTDHFDGEAFFNPWAPRPKKGFWDMLKWRFNGERADWPESADNPARPPIAPRSDTLKITYIGHATLLLQASNVNLLIDPVFSERCSPFAAVGPKRVRPPFVPLETLPPIDYVFVSHNHYDHLDQPSLSWLARNRRPVFIAPLGNARLIAPCGDKCQIVSLDWHEETTLAGKLSLHLTPAQHWSRRGFNDINRDLWGGFFLKTGAGQSVFYCGDSGFHEATFQAIRDRYGAADVALLPIGAYAPRWFMKYSHMNPAEAVRIHTIMGAQRSMAFHFETFQLTDEAIDAPRMALTAALKAASLQANAFMAPYPGDSLSL